jgi:hypothetical protein
MTKEEVQVLIDNGAGRGAIAKHFKVTEGVVRTFLEKNGLRTKRMAAKSQQGKSCVCKHCGKEYIYRRVKGGTLEQCNSCQTNKRRFKLKDKCLEYKGGKCSACGYDTSKRALTFHHRDPSQKDFTISGNHCLSWKRVKAELDKCELLCMNCHMEEHERLDESKK